MSTVEVVVVSMAAANMIGKIGSMDNIDKKGCEEYKYIR